MSIAVKQIDRTQFIKHTIAFALGAKPYDRYPANKAESGWSKIDIMIAKMFSNNPPPPVQRMEMLYKRVFYVSGD